HTCTYVGRDGIARFVCKGDRDTLSTHEVFLFRDATDLRIGQTRHYTNGVYQNTSYNYTWTDVAGVKRYVISGSHRSQAGTPALKDPYYFATAGELAWTMSLLDHLQAQLTLGGAIPFQLKGGDHLRVAPGHLTLCLGGQTAELDAQDIAAMNINQG